MTPRSRQVINEASRALLSLFFGSVVTAFLVLSLFCLDEALFDSNSNLEPEERLPVWWLLTWPYRLWSQVLSSDSSAMAATLLTHLCVFSAVSYAVLRSRARRPPRLD
jgi:ABC-type spermidine/putrescine transport system permease subunit I